MDVAVLKETMAAGTIDDIDEQLPDNEGSDTLFGIVETTESSTLDLGVVDSSRFR